MVALKPAVISVCFLLSLLGSSCFCIAGGPGWLAHVASIATLVHPISVPEQCEPKQNQPRDKPRRRLFRALGETCSPRLHVESTMEELRQKIRAGNTTLRIPSLLRLGEGLSISQEMIDRASYLGDPTLLRDLLKKTSTQHLNSTLDVHIIGGSFTGGAFEKGDRKNDWSHPKRDRWSEKFQIQTRSWGFKITNWAKGGVDTGAWLHREPLWQKWRKHPPDLIVAELAVNEQKIRGSATLERRMTQIVERMQKLRPAPALLFVEVFRTSGFSGERRYCMKPTNESRYVKHPTWKNYSYCTHWWEIATAHQKVLQALRVPYFSYRDMVWPSLLEPPVELPLFWNGLSHADWIAHQLLAEGLMRMLVKANEELCLPEGEVNNRSEPNRTVLAKVNNRSEPTAEGEIAIGASVAEEAYCTSTLLTQYTAEDGADKFRPATTLPEGSAWMFFEDVPGKPGWIGDASASFNAASNDSLIISFGLDIGNSKMLTLQFTLSYHSMGKVLIWLDGNRQDAHIVDAFSTECFSVVESFTLPVRDEGEHTLFIQLLTRTDVPSSAPPLYIFRGNKFKVVGLFSC